jgi:hypothetical protein
MRRAMDAKRSDTLPTLATLLPVSSVMTDYVQLMLIRKRLKARFHLMTCNLRCPLGTLGFLASFVKGCLHVMLHHPRSPPWLEQVISVSLSLSLSLSLSRMRGRIWALESEP